MRGSGSESERERACRWLARGRKERRSFPTAGVGDVTPFAPVNGKKVDDGDGRGDTSRRGKFMEISSSETVMHVSPISVTERLIGHVLSSKQ